MGAALPGMAPEMDPFHDIEIPPELEDSLRRHREHLARLVATLGLAGVDKNQIEQSVAVNADNVLGIAERLRLRLESVVVPHSPPIQVTASFGVTMLDREIDSVPAWLAEADNALYEAKASGRNRCCLSKQVAC